VFDGDRPGLPALDLALFRRRLDAGARVVDVRPVIDFATARVPGSISNELRPQFASYLDWTVDPVVPLLFVTNPDTDLDDLVSQCLNIGYERLAGHLSGGVLRWRDAGFPVGRIEIVDADMLDRATVLDVRQTAEFAASHVPDAMHFELGRLTDSAGSVPADRPVVTMCAHGQCRRCPARACSPGTGAAPPGSACSPDRRTTGPPAPGTDPPPACDDHAAAGAPRAA
jgi:rhodanese-related sulfurtransferase